MTTLGEHIIVAGAENHPPMLEKSMYDSWASRIRLFIKGKKHGKMMFDSINNGLLAYPTIEEDGQTRLKKYSELTEAQQLQDDCDVQATNIILHGLPPDVGIATTSRKNYAAGQAKVVKCYNYLGEGHMVKQCTQPKRPRSSAWFKEKLMLAETQEAGDKRKKFNPELPPTPSRTLGSCAASSSIAAPPPRSSILLEIHHLRLQPRTATWKPLIGQPPVTCQSTWRVNGGQ
nr:hypothetical protein [Tanacetum cinerariifolium]